MLVLSLWCRETNKVSHHKKMLLGNWLRKKEDNSRASNKFSLAWVLEVERIVWAFWSSGRSTSSSFWVWVTFSSTSTSLACAWIFPSSIVFSNSASLIFQASCASSQCQAPFNLKQLCLLCKLYFLTKVLLGLQFPYKNTSEFILLLLVACFVKIKTWLGKQGSAKSSLLNV